MKEALDDESKFDNNFLQLIQAISNYNETMQKATKLRQEGSTLMDAYACFAIKHCELSAFSLCIFPLAVTKRNVITKTIINVFKRLR